MSGSSADVSMHNLSKSGVSRALDSNKASVREIMAECQSTIGIAGKTSMIKKDLDKMNQEQDRTDEAMDKLKELFEEYCE